VDDQTPLIATPPTMDLYFEKKWIWMKGKGGCVFSREKADSV
jgi:hypothetical protein